MDAIETMRAMMCWERENLIEHDKCMGWMVDACIVETTGQGYCKKFRHYLKAECRAGKQKACVYAKQMGGYTAIKSKGSTTVLCGEKEPALTATLDSVLA